MVKKVVPNELKTHLIDQMIESVSEPANTIYYAFVGDHTSSGATEEDVVQPTTSQRDLNVDTYRKMIFGKKIDPGDMFAMIPRHDWNSGDIYDIYDDQDVYLSEKPFYVVVDESEYKHIYKCLFNSDGNPSVIQPVFGDVYYDSLLYEEGDDYYETSDGYQWKYMYSIDSTTFSKFATDKWIPVQANTTVERNAVAGKIDVIKVEDKGKNYNNSISGRFTLSDVKINGDPLLYKLPDNASQVQDFYANTIISLTSGKGAGQWARVTESYVQNNIGVIAKIEESFNPEPDATTNWEISPEVKVSSDGTQLENCIARALIDGEAANSIYKVEIIEPGSGYNFATAEVLVGTIGIANSTNRSSGDIISPTTAIVRPIIPPQGGHGANSAIELGATALCIYTEFNGDESISNGGIANLVPTDNSFAQFGIIRDPKFANVEIYFTKLSDGLEGSDGQFIEGETVYQLEKLKLHGHVVCEDGNTQVLCTETDAGYDEFLRGGEFIYIRDPNVTTSNYISTVDSVGNSTLIQLSDELPFNSSLADIYIARVVASGTVNQIIDSRSFYLKNCSVRFRKDEVIIGTSSYATAVISGIDVNDSFAAQEDSEFSFNTFNQMTRAIGSINGTFIEDEIVYQGSSLETAFARAYCHTQEDTSTLNITDILGTFDTAYPIKGYTSEATVDAPWNKYSGDLDQTSGTIIYLQNDVPIERNPDQTEEVRIILEF